MAKGPERVDPVPTFHYAARNGDGTVLVGEQEAVTEYEALRAIQSRGLLVTKLADASAAATAERSHKRLHRRVSGQDLLLLLRQLSTLLGAGVTLLAALEVVSTQTESQRLARALEAIKGDIRAGSTLRDALAKHPNLFPTLWPLLIAAGEATGKLPIILSQLAGDLEASQRIKAKFTTALVYPTLLTVMAAVVVLVFLMFIIPVFQRLYAMVGGKLPALTTMVIALSTLVRRHVWLLVGGSAIAWLLGRRYAATPSGRQLRDRLSLRLPLFGAFLQDVIHERIARNLFILIKGGVNILPALEVTARSAGNTLFEQAIGRVRDDVRQGKSLAAAMSRHPVFSSLTVQMVMVGEESGQLEQLMGRVASYYEEQVDAFINRLSVLIEPAILIIIGAVVGVIVVAMFLPVLRLAAAIK